VVLDPYDVNIDGDLLLVRPRGRSRVLIVALLLLFGGVSLHVTIRASVAGAPLTAVLFGVIGAAVTALGLGAGAIRREVRVHRVTRQWTEDVSILGRRVRRHVLAWPAGSDGSIREMENLHVVTWNGRTLAVLSSRSRAEEVLRWLGQSER
jgi:hypothetical protein